MCVQNSKLKFTKRQNYLPSVVLEIGEFKIEGPPRNGRTCRLPGRCTFVPQLLRHESDKTDVCACLTSRLTLSTM